MLAGQPEGVVAVGGQNDVIALFREVVADQLRDVAFVLDQEHALGVVVGDEDGDPALPQPEDDGLDVAALDQALPAPAPSRNVASTSDSATVGWWTRSSSFCRKRTTGASSTSDVSSAAAVSGDSPRSSSKVTSSPPTMPSSRLGFFKKANR